MVTGGMEPTWPWLRELEMFIKNISESKIAVVTITRSEPPDLCEASSFLLMHLCLSWRGTGGCPGPQLTSGPSDLPILSSVPAERAMCLQEASWAHVQATGLTLGSWRSGWGCTQAGGWAQCSPRQLRWKCLCPAGNWAQCAQHRAAQLPAAASKQKESKPLGFRVCLNTGGSRRDKFSLTPQQQTCATPEDL